MKYLFSVVMAVYNTEQFLREAVDSLVRQDIGFDRIQLILVDDGSTDASGTVCDEYAARYPENIVVIHRENGGVSAARNAGLACAEGEYVNFMDSDDRMAPDAFSRVYAFYRENRTLTDVVSIPMVYFGGKQGPHALNTKFEKGTRLIDLTKEWDAVQLSSSTAFFRREALTAEQFTPMLKYAEDAALVQRVLLRKQTLGVIADTAYHYRVRSGGAQSAMQRARQDPAWYLPKMKYFFEDTASFCRRELGCIPRFVQFTLMYDLQGHVRQERIPAGVLDHKQRQEYLERMYGIYSCIDDDLILAQKDLSFQQKYYVLTKKNGTPPEFGFSQDELCFICNGRAVGPVESCEVGIDFIRLEKDRCLIEAFPSIPPLSDCRVHVEMDGVLLPCERLPVERFDTFFKEKTISYSVFRAELPLPPGSGAHNARICIEYQGRRLYPACRFHQFSPITDRYQNAYYCHDGWCLQYQNGSFSLSPVRFGTRLGREVRFLWELVAGKRKSRKAAALRVLYWLARPWKRKPLWLVSDRRIRAGDNGEAFFRFLRAEHPEIDARFIIQRSAKAYPELKKIGKVLENDTWQEKLLTLLSDYLVSSQADDSYINPFHRHKPVFQDLMADRRFVFLQHGVTKDDMSGWLKRSAVNLYGFVTAAPREYQSIVGDRYGYTEKEVWLTGMPRYDRLTGSENARLITVMPTWRKNLTGKLDPHQMDWGLASGFTNSEYFRFYSSLLSSERLLKAAKEYGYSLAFFPHPNLQPHIEVFHLPSDVRMLGLETEYRTVYAESALVVTDYSSAVFDFAYMGRPVLYAQFDRDTVFGEHIGKEGYFDYEQDGFGEVEYDLESTADRIIEYMQNGCMMKPQYQQRVKDFFAFRDRDNCRRVYERMIES